MFEAQKHETKMQDIRLRLLKATGGATEAEAVRVKERQRDEELEKSFEREERAKKRIEQVRKDVAGVARARGQGSDTWRKEELKVRGSMGEAVKSGFLVESLPEEVV